MAYKKNSFKQVWLDPETDETWHVTYHYEGSFTSGTLEEPPEYPELEIDSITNMADGRDFGEATQELIDYINSNHVGDDDYDDYHGEY